MNWSDVITLVSEQPEYDDDGFPIEGGTEESTVFANRKSVKSSEYYAAKETGVELSYIFEIRSAEYNGETKIKYEDDTHEVERSYMKGEFVELTCKRESDNHES